MSDKDRITDLARQNAALKAALDLVGDVACLNTDWLNLTELERLEICRIVDYELWDEGADMPPLAAHDREVRRAFAADLKERILALRDETLGDTTNHQIAIIAGMVGEAAND